MPGKLLNVFAHSAGGGKLLAVLQFKKSSPADEGRQRQAALGVLRFPGAEARHLVDEDVDIFDSDDVLWAMQTRYRGDVDTVMILGVRCHPLDPSQVPEYSQSVLQQGMSCKTIFDCTVPFHLKHNFERSKFKAVDVNVSCRTSNKGEYHDTTHHHWD